MNTYLVRVGEAGTPIEVECEGWLRAAELGAARLGVERRDVQVRLDDRVGFVSPKVVTA